MFRSLPLLAVLAATTAMSGCAVIVDLLLIPQTPASNIVPGEFFGSSFEGTYLCAQGETGVRLTFTPGADPNVLDGIFEFYPIPSNPGVSTGRFRMRGTRTLEGLVAMRGVEWLDRPAGYEMVNVSLRPQVVDGLISGTVDGIAGCDWIRVRSR
jgi:hypothetical protein